MAMQPAAEEAKAGAPDWLVTFADLMSLLLTFFVLLLSFSNIEVEKFKTLAGSIRSAFGLRSPFDLNDRATGSEMMPHKAPSELSPLEQSQDRLMLVKLRDALERAGVEGKGTVKVTADGVVLKLDGDLMFGSGDTAIKPEAKQILDYIASIAANAGGTVEVQGHTDDVPISSARFPSNWELSSARAGSAVRYLTSRGVPPSRLRALGFADTRPVAPNSDPDNRARNRRVEFLFLNVPSGGSPEGGPAG